MIVIGSLILCVQRVGSNSVRITSYDSSLTLPRQTCGAWCGLDYQIFVVKQVSKGGDQQKEMTKQLWLTCPVQPEMENLPAVTPLVNGWLSHSSENQQNLSYISATQLCVTSLSVSGSNRQVNRVPYQTICQILLLVPPFGHLLDYKDYRAYFTKIQ